MATETVRVLVVEDDARLLRQQLRILRSSKDIEVVGGVRDGPSALESAARHCGLLPSRTDLRREVAEVCGEPKRLRILAEGAICSQEPDDRFAIGSETQPEPPQQDPEPSEDDANPAGPQAAQALPRPSSKSGILRDPLLLYFLRKAGVRFAELPAARPSSNAKSATGK